MITKEELTELENETTILFNKYGFKTPKRILPNIIFDWMTPTYCFKVRMRTLLSKMTHTKNFLVDNDGNIIVGSPTILNTSAATGPMSWKLKSIFSGNSTVYTSAPFTGNWSEIAGGFSETDSGFGQSLSFFASQNYPSQTLFQRYWKKYIQETYSEASREVKINIKLSVNDIDGWQFNEKFYYKNTLFRLISLSGISLTSNDSYVSATFMKRFTVFNIDIAPFYPYNVVNSIVQWKDSLTNLPLSPNADGRDADQTDLENSAIAYGFFYDSVKDVATQQGQILIT